MLELCLRLVQCLVELHYGAILGSQFGPSFLCDFLVANKRTDSVLGIVPQCNSRRHRPSLELNLKMTS